MQESDEDMEFPIAYSIDNEILMHRDAHFGGSFPIMLEYYVKEGKGVCQDFDLRRIEELAQMELQTGKNLSPLMLSGAEAERVALARQSYKKLKDLYEIRNPKSLLPKKIADLILAEDEAETEKAIEAIIAEKSAIVSALIDLLKNEDFYNPLFPGYGQAPVLAAQCLGRIGDKRAIISLFEAIGEGDFFSESIILDALHAIGQPAKDFLLKVLHGHPITMVNEQAAIALIRFKQDSEVSNACLQILKEIDLSKNLALATYLVLACEGLASPQQKELLALAENKATPKSIKQDIAAVAHAWD